MNKRFINTRIITRIKREKKNKTNETDKARVKDDTFIKNTALLLQLGKYYFGKLAMNQLYCSNHVGVKATFMPLTT